MFGVVVVGVLVVVGGGNGRDENGAEGSGRRILRLDEHVRACDALSISCSGLVERQTRDLYFVRTIQPGGHISFCKTKSSVTGAERVIKAHAWCLDRTC